MAELEYLRDTGFPYLLQRLYRWEVLLSVFSGRSEENARQAKDFFFSVQNSRKARDGGLAGLLDPAIMAKKTKAGEEAARRRWPSDPKLKDAPSAWDTDRRGAEDPGRQHPPTTPCWKRAAGFNSKLFDIARTLVRAAEELPKPNGERLREFRDSNLRIAGAAALLRGADLRRLRDAQAGRLR